MSHAPLLFLQGSASIGRMAGDKHDETETERTERIRSIEADIAFFEARLAFANLGEDNPHKQAQRRAFESLKESLSETLKELQKS